MPGQGTATLDFDAFPGASDASVAVTGKAGILAGSLAEAWIFPAATADHSADEHLVETIRVMAGSVVAGTGFTIYGVNTNQLNEPVLDPPPANVVHGNGTATIAKATPPGNRAYGGGRGTLLYGKFNIGWCWN